MAGQRRVSYVSIRCPTCGETVELTRRSFSIETRYAPLDAPCGGQHDVNPRVAHTTCAAGHGVVVHLTAGCQRRFCLRRRVMATRAES